MAHAVAVFGGEQEAACWLSTQAPAELLDTEEGLDLVERTLIRIELKIPT